MSATGPETAAWRAPVWVGVGAVALGAAIMGFSAISARFAYLGGTNVVTLLAIRFTFMAVVLFAFARALRVPLGLPRRLVPAAFGLGVAFTLTAYGYIGAVAYIPVSLSVLLIYTFPLVVAFLAYAFRGERFTAIKVVAALVAFVGIAVMMGVSFAGLDWRGVALAVLGSLSFAAATVGGASVMREVSVPVIVAHMSGVAAVVFVTAGAATGGFVLPTGVPGWSGTAGVSISFLLGFAFYFFGVKTIGETRSAVIANLEPVVSVLAAFALLGESFTPAQGVGAVLTLGGVTALVWEDARLKRRPALAD